MIKVITKYGGFVFILAIIILILEGDFFSRSPLVIIGQVVGVILLISGRASFGKQQFSVGVEPGSGELITHGAYRLIRHPIYAGALLITLVSILGHLSVVNVVIGLAVLFMVLYRISLEEDFLRQKYPDYTEYAARTKKIIPYVF